MLTSKPAVNCNDNADLDGDVFMNHGWGSLQIFEPIDLNAEYTTYTHMKQGKVDPSLWFGDIVILNSKDQVAAYFGQAIVRSFASLLTFNSPRSSFYLSLFHILFPLLSKRIQDIWNSLTSFPFRFSRLSEES